MTKKMTLCLILIACLFASCNTAPLYNIPVSEAVNVDGARKAVVDARDLSIKANERLISAQAELAKAKKETEAAKALVAEMKQKNSPYADKVERLRNEYEIIVDVLTKQLQETGIILQSQLESLKKAGIELDKAREASAISEREKESLRLAIKQASQELTKAQKEVQKLQSWKDKNMWYKKFFWWTVIGVLLFTVGYAYFTGATGGITRFFSPVRHQDQAQKYLFAL